LAFRHLSARAAISKWKQLNKPGLSHEPQVNAIAGRLSLARAARSLEILDRITEIVPPRKAPTSPPLRDPL